MAAAFIAPISTEETSITALLPFSEVSVVNALDVASDAYATGVAL